MNEQDILRQQIDSYLIEYGVDRTKPNCYYAAAKRFGVSTEYIRDRYKKLRKKGLVKDGYTQLTTTTLDSSWKEDVKSGNADVTTVTEKRITTLQDLIQVCKINTNDWNIEWWECNKWEVGAKNAASELVIKPLFQVKAKLSRKKVSNDLTKQKEAIIEELRDYSPSHADINKFWQMMEKRSINNNKYLCELSLSDHHFGKLSWHSESGEDYDIKIAETRWKAAIENLLSKVDHRSIDRFLLPIGNDLFHIDNKSNLTTAGTNVEADTRFFKMVKVVKRILIETIDKLLVIAPVDVIIVPGNHDYHSSLWMGDILDAWYNKNDYVTVDYEPKPRKYYQYGKVGIQLTHGNEENHKDLGLLFATQAKQMWFETEYHYCQLGHYHKAKKVQYVDVDEHQGFQVEILPSLCGTDSWHFKKGYSSGKAAKAFLFHKETGKEGEFFYNHPIN